ncbi:unnamed protein product [Bursaphelenchus xylophilus]|uniref:Oligopeptide transporter 1 n=1 Tax=Bursaphelenchus xylophilus TaxID=6326 RepID=A0A1I7S8T3_BURXY|nr:unnamed protein product [Bursaphelenchus xylophilus]CAG9085827.1 unnamed protein product [Bursaphelenchus xylophilus]
MRSVDHATLPVGFPRIWNFVWKQRNGAKKMRHKNSMFSLPDDPNRPRFVPAAEPLLLVDSGEPSSRRSSTSRVPVIPSIESPDLKTPEDEDIQDVGLIKSVRSYPPGVFFMLGNEFCERFSFYGMRAVLTLYLIHEYQLADSTASLLYHLFISLAYFSPLFGSVVADNYFGRFKVILWVSVIYVIGHMLLSAGALPYFSDLTRALLDVGGLALIALGTGGIKPCVSAFAADQFEESQVQERTQFFSFFYFSINAGSLVAIIVTPLLRARLQCFGSDYCFPLAFGVPGVLMAIAFFTFIAGYKYYKIKPAEKGNILWKVISCIWTALRKKLRAVMRREQSDKHWLQYASPEHDENLINGVKSLVAVSLLFVPVVFFWALFDQQGSTWVIQARRMDGRVGPFTILPDQMNTFNPLMILFMVPIFEAFIYPCLHKVVVITPLRKMAMGGVLAALSFVIAGILQIKVNSSMESMPLSGQAFVYRLGNSVDTLVSQNGLILAPGKNAWPEGIYDFQIENRSFSLELHGGKSYVAGISIIDDKLLVNTFEYKCEKVENGRTRIYLLTTENSKLIGHKFYILDSAMNVNQETVIRPGQSVDIVPNIVSYPQYTLAYGNCNEALQCDHEIKINATVGSAHVIDVDQGGLRTMIVRPNSVSVLWQLPQYMVMTWGEILFSVTGLEFSYSQASPSMKSVLQAIWLMTTFFGNVIDMSISGSHLIREPEIEFFVYAFLMLVVIGVFVLIAMNYTYVEDDLEMTDSQQKPADTYLKPDDNAAF